MDKASQHFLDILETKQIIEGILEISSYDSINQKILSTGIKKTIFSMFLGIKCDINQAVNDISTNPSVKNLQDIDMNKTGKFGVCGCN